MENLPADLTGRGTDLSVFGLLTALSGCAASGNRTHAHPMLLPVAHDWLFAAVSRPHIASGSVYAACVSVCCRLSSVIIYEYHRFHALPLASNVKSELRSSFRAAILRPHDKEKACAIVRTGGIEPPSPITQILSLFLIVSLFMA